MPFLQKLPLSCFLPNYLCPDYTMTFGTGISVWTLFFCGRIRTLKRHISQKGTTFLNLSYAESHPGQPILSRKLGRSSKTFAHHFKGVLLRTCSFHFMQVWAKFTFPGQTQFLVHLHAGSLSLFCRAVYCQARFNDLLASLPLKAENLLLPPCLWMIKKKKKTEPQRSSRTSIGHPTSLKDRAGWVLVHSDSPHPERSTGPHCLSAGQHNMPPGADVACHPDHPSRP